MIAKLARQLSLLALLTMVAVACAAESQPDDAADSDTAAVADDTADEAPTAEDTDDEDAPADTADDGEDGAAAGAALVVAYNSPTEWANWGGVLSAFSDATGIEAPNDPKNSGQTLAALQAEAASPVADTAYWGIVFGFEAVDQGLVDAYQPPGFDEIPDALKDPDGYWFTVHQGAIAFLVNTDELGDTPVPECWEDLTDPVYAGQVGFLDPTQAAVGYSVMTAVNLALGGSLDDFGPGIEWAQQMAANDVVLPAQTATAAVQQGEIPILIDADFNGYRLAEVDDAPIQVVLPCEGSLAIPYTMSLVANAPRPDAGRALLDFALSDEGQALFAESYLRPVRDVDVPDEISQAFLPEEQYAELVRTPDFGEMNAAQSTFEELWNAEVN
jgi:putative spermidine/putrescine transport system substrate-binding protein